MRLSVLDQSTAVSGREEADAVRETLALAQFCDRLGYERFWVSEHHNHPSIVGTAPEILVAAIAATTRRIRVGSAGVMLPHYSALHVAEQFRVLEAIAPGRIDMGLGRAPGGDMPAAFALNPQADTAADYFPNQVRDLLAWVGGEKLPEGHPFWSVAAHPKGATVPEAWILGSSNYGAQVGAFFGLPYCFAWFFTDGRGAPEALATYRQQYRPSARHPAPHSSICVWVLAAETRAEAERLFLPRALWRVLRDRNILLPLPTPEEAAAYDLAGVERAKIERMTERAFIGTAAEIAPRLRTLAAELAVDELVIVTWSHDPEARRRSYELLAAEFGLAPTAPAS
jgi:luciferase family oxidoreductase group 1